MASWRNIRGSLVFLFASALGPPTVAQSQDAAVSASQLSARLTQTQNAERKVVGLRPFTWDAQLAVEASAYAAELASTGKWEHSSPDRRQDEGENLWMGTRGAFTPEQMVGDWLSERPMFHAGVFPDVSRNGSWHDVGHYTQIIWPDTLRVGCGMRSSATFDYLVCRYSAAGNVIGEQVGTIKLSSR